MNKDLKNKKPKERSIFLMNMNCWLSNFLIESLRTEIQSDNFRFLNSFMGTMNSSDHPLPYLFKPTEVKVDFDHLYRSDIFKNDVFIIDLNTCNLKEVEYIINGLKNIKTEESKTLVVISSVLTWTKTKKTYKDAVKP